MPEKNPMMGRCVDMLFLVVEGGRPSHMTIATEAWIETVDKTEECWNYSPHNAMLSGWKLVGPPVPSRNEFGAAYQWLWMFTLEVER
jgi:hypothetical protein